MDILEFRDINQPPPVGKIIGNEENAPGPNRVKIGLGMATLLLAQVLAVGLKFLVEIMVISNSNIRNKKKMF